MRQIGQIGGMTIALLLLATVAFSQSSDFTYRGLGDGEIVITGYIGTNTTIRIPEEIDGKLVEKVLCLSLPRNFWAPKNSRFPTWKHKNSTSIPHPFSRKNDWIERIEIPTNITNIFELAFLSCPSLSSITVDEDNPVYSSKNGMLLDKNQTKLLCFPPRKSIKCTLPKSLKTIGMYAIHGNSSTRTLTIPSAVTHIMSSAISGCPNLETLMIPTSVISINSGAVSQCEKFTRFEVDPLNPAYSSEDGMLLNKDKTKLICFPPAKSPKCTLPKSLKTISKNAIRSNSNPRTLKIPPTATHIDTFAISFCHNLERVIIPASVIFIAPRSVAICRNFTRFEVAPLNPVYSSEDGVLFNRDKTALIQFPAKKPGRYTIPDSVGVIGPDAFREYSNFSGRSSLTNIIISNSDVVIKDKTLSSRKNSR